MHDIWLEEDMNLAVKTLSEGGIILYPTDTIWGLGCDASDEAAIRKIYQIKQREISRPFIVLVNGIDMLKRYVTDIHPRVETLLTLHERPLTIIYPQVGNLPDLLKSADGKMAVRVTRDPYCNALITGLGRPIVSSSANIAGNPHPKGFGEISLSIMKKVDYVAKHRQHERNTGMPSVIATYDYRGQLEFIRS